MMGVRNTLPEPQDRPVVADWGECEVMNARWDSLDFLSVFADNGGGRWEPFGASSEVRPGSAMLHRPGASARLRDFQETRPPSCSCRRNPMSHNRIGLPVKPTQETGPHSCHSSGQPKQGLGLAAMFNRETASQRLPCAALIQEGCLPIVCCESVVTWSPRQHGRHPRRWTDGRMRFQAHRHVRGRREYAMSVRHSPVS